MRARLPEWLPTVLLLAGAASFVFLFLQVRSQTQQVHRQAEQGRQALIALCAFKHDLEVRVLGSRQFLKDHPAGIPGIPASLIRNGLRNQQATLDSLGGLNC